MNQPEALPVARFITDLPAASQAAVMAMAEPWQATTGECIFRHQAPVSALWMIDQGQVRFQFVTSLLCPSKTLHRPALRKPRTPPKLLPRFRP